MSNNNIISKVRSYLASNHMFVDEDWLTGCIEYLLDDGNNSYSEQDIHNLAKEQWLLNDLKDICPGSLPNNLKNQQKFQLNGRFVLQINAAMDIGTSAYQQYLKIKKVNTENIEATTNYEEKIPSHRMIKLYMTDGAQELCGIEYRPMRNLSCDITPGCKALIKGPVECRRGVLLLTESSIELLGGEVQDILESNLVPGLLTTKLGVPAIQASDLITNVRNTNIPPTHTQAQSWHNEQPAHFDQTSRPVARVTSLQVASFADDDIDMDQLAAIEAEFSNPSKRAMADDITKPEKRLKINPTTSVNKVEDYPEENDLFFEDEEYLTELEAKFDANENQLNGTAKNVIKVEAEPFVYIKQINDMKECDKVGKVFKVKGQIIKLLSKLSVGKDGWSLRCSIVDGSDCIDVDFTSDVLSKLVGFTPQEMNLLKKQMSSKPELKEKAVSALQKAKDSLQVLYCIIELTILDTPKITRLIPFEDRHVDLIRSRSRDSGL